MKNIEGFNQIHVEQIKVGQFFFFPNGKSRMVCEDVKRDIAWTTITATSSKGKTHKRSITNFTLIYVYK